MKLPLVIIVISLDLAVADKYLKFYKAEFETNPKFVANSSSKLTVPARNRVLASYEGQMLEDLKNVTFNFRGYKFYNQFRPFLINEWINVCSVIRNFESYNYFVKTLKRIISRYGNIFQCPYKVNPYQNWVRKYSFIIIFFFPARRLLCKKYGNAI